MHISESIGTFKALADKSRLMIVNTLMDKPQYVEEIAQRLNLAVSTTSFHLKKLETAKLVHKEKQQYYSVYSVNMEIINKRIKEMVTFENLEKIIQKERIENYKQKVKDTFFKNGRLTKIPVQHKKRWIVLEAIADKFKHGKKYPENEVNRIIKTFFNDYCTIRRYFIDEKVMARKDSVYWLCKTNPGDKPHGLRKSFLDSVDSIGKSN